MENLPQPKRRNPATPHWQPLEPPDLAAVSRLAARIHPALPERPEVFAEKVRLFPAGCRKLVSPDAIVGYGLAHPWLLGRIPPLDDFLGEIPHDADCLYLHDLAISREYQGQGLAASYVDAITTVARARGIHRLALVSVYGTDVVWSKYGFKTLPLGDDRTKLGSYGPSAKYMTRALS